MSLVKNDAIANLMPEVDGDGKNFIESTIVSPDRQLILTSRVADCSIKFNKDGISNAATNDRVVLKTHTVEHNGTRNKKLKATEYYVTLHHTKKNGDVSYLKTAPVGEDAIEKSLNSGKVIKLKVETANGRFKNIKEFGIKASQINKQDIHSKINYKKFSWLKWSGGITVGVAGLALLVCLL